MMVRRPHKTLRHALNLSLLLLLSFPRSAESQCGENLIVNGGFEDVGPPCGAVPPGGLINAAFNNDCVPGWQASWGTPSVCAFNVFAGRHVACFGTNNEGMFQALSFPPTSCGPYTLTFWYRGIKGFRGFLVVYLANGLVNVPSSHSGWNPFIALPAWQFVHGVNVTDDQWHKATVTGLVPVDPANTQLLFQDVPAFLDVAIDEVQLVTTPLDAGEIGLDIDCEGQSGGTLTFSSTWIDLPSGIDPQTIEWDFGDGDHATGQTVTHTFADLGTYDVCATISNPCGCESTVCAPFTIDPCYCACAAVNPPEATGNWVVPNIFSPNGDGINDRFKPYAKGAGAVIHRLDIYDRWGGKFYGLAGSRPLEEEPGWDGTIGGVAVNPGVYTYVIELTDASGERIRLAGDVTVLR